MKYGGEGTTPRVILSKLLKDTRHAGGFNKIAILMNMNPNRLRNQLLGFIVMPGETQRALKQILRKRLKKLNKKET